MPSEFFTIETPNGEYRLPVYSPDATAEHAHRVTGPNQDWAFKLEVNPPDDADHALRVGLPNGAIAGLSRVTATLLEGFEDGAWPDTWTDETNYYGLTTNAIDGQYTLEATSASSQQVANPTISTPRGHTYSMRAVPQGSDGAVWLLTNVQDEQNALGDCYAARLEPGQSELSLYKRQSGSTSNLGTVSVSASAGTEYQVVLDVDSSQAQARVFDAGGTELAATGYQSDSTHSGGYVGIYNSGSDADGTRYDSFKQHSLGGV